MRVQDFQPQRNRYLGIGLELGYGGEGMASSGGLVVQLPHRGRRDFSAPQMWSLYVIKYLKYYSA